MVYRGTVQHGVVVLPEGVQLPDGMEVTVDATLPAQGTIVANPPPRNGVPIFPRVACDTPPDMALVNALRDDPL